MSKKQSRDLALTLADDLDPYLDVLNDCNVDGEQARAIALVENAQAAIRAAETVVAEWRGTGAISEVAMGLLESRIQRLPPQEEGDDEE